MHVTILIVPKGLGLKATDKEVKDMLKAECLGTKTMDYSSLLNFGPVGTGQLRSRQWFCCCVLFVERKTRGFDVNTKRPF